MKLKLDSDGHVVVQDGKPVYVQDDGKEVAFDAAGTVSTISRLNAEAKSNRERYETAEKSLSAFDGLDAEAARGALDTVSKIDAKKLVEAGDMDAAIKTAISPYQKDLDAERKKNETLTASLAKEVVGNAFGRSKFATKKLTPAGVDLIRTMYGDSIKVEDGKPVGLDESGQKLYSRSRPGELADFDEVVENFVNRYPHKDHILKGSAASGGGASSNNGGGAGKKSYSRAEFDKLDPATQSQVANDARAGKAEILD